jgi:AcrR family transcriptional regulator
MAEESDIAQRRALARSIGDPEYRLRREEIISAAARVFRRKGFRAAKLQDIAKEIGKDRASLYYYTSGKDELFQDVVAEAVRKNVEMVEQLYKEKISSIEKLRALVVQLMESYEAHYPYLFVYVQEPMAHLDDSTEWNRMMIALQRRFDEGIRGIIRQGLKDGSLNVPQENVRLIANAIIGMCSWSHRWYHPTDTSSGKQIGTVFADAILNGLAKKAD